MKRWNPDLDPTGELYADYCDRVYDERVDEILLSEDYKTCKERGAGGDCKLEKTRCWHVWRCPLMKPRKEEQEWK
jgi:hypothetical protein